MSSDKQGRATLDSDDEDGYDGAHLEAATSTSKRNVFNLPPPVLGKPSKGGLLDDDDDQSGAQDGIQESQQERDQAGFLVTKVPIHPIEPSGSTFSSSNVTEVPLAPGSSREVAGGLRLGLGGLKTVHSGRSLSSVGSQKSKPKAGSVESQALPHQQSQRRASKAMPDTDPADNGRPGLTLRGIAVRPRFRKKGNNELPPVNSRAALFASKVKTRRNRFSTSSRSSTKLALTSLNRVETPPSQARRYKPKDHVLVCNHQSRWANLVNRYGFPPGEGATPEEQRGPYIYVICIVKEVHFEEFAAYYTVDRCDTGAEQRADADFMEPMRSDRGKAAALRAATQSSAEAPDENGEFEGDNDRDMAGGISRPQKVMMGMQNCCDFLMIPFFWLFDFLNYYLMVSCILPVWASSLRYSRGQVRRILNGLDPYVCRMRLTVINFVVLCSTWYMFIDQARLAFFPARVDDALAIVNLAVWLVLVLELLFQVFIRPDGFKQLIVSDKAYAPTTVRFINSFHFIIEALCLMIFVPEWYCLVSTYECDDRMRFSFHNAILMSVTGPTRLETFYGKAFLALLRLRVFGLVRHWKNMWITNTFINMKSKSTPNGLLSAIFPRASSERKSLIAKKGGHIDESEKREINLANASTIGTALMVTNSYRALAILWIITGIFPLLTTFSSTYTNAMAPVMTRQLQESNRLATDTSNSTCNFLADSVLSWMVGFTSPGFSPQGSQARYLVDLRIEPPDRCEYLGFEKNAITVTACEELEKQANESGLPLNDTLRRPIASFCDTWRPQKNGTKPEIARKLGLRTGSILLFKETAMGNLTQVAIDGTVGITTENVTYSVKSLFDETFTIRKAALCSLLLQLTLLIAVLGGLSVLRRDAEVLVLKPLRHMLKIVARYAKNPLVPPKIKRRVSPHNRGSLSARLQADDTSNSDEDSDVGTEEEMDTQRNGLGGDDLGSYETEQLITAVTKITDLLRKCWGVAGADIISTNLATQEGALSEVFNPTVPGKSVYALFGFAAINGFDHCLRNLNADVMILINDVAAVLHDEVFRWGLGDSGQCNKNLGNAFLMVFRIGLVSEVVIKLKEAQDVIFSSGATKASIALADKKRTDKLSSAASGHASKHGHGPSASMKNVSTAKNAAATIKRKIKRNASVKAMSLSLESLPGISTFTDRAVIGMLKSFAGIYRDNKIREWNNDFRLSAGVGTFTVSMIYGMDAGWAVEGAVGSEYKIDATYLSPHVNMASRMMSACKQYGVNILLSQAVQELMSDVAQSKLRHLDTVTVKGSSVKQRIYTYDARPKGVDFFLYSKSDEQADCEADRYSPKSWNNDADLKAMRQHVSEEFWDEFDTGRRAFLAGNWKEAIKRLERANELMIENALEEGYLEDEFEALASKGDAKALEELKLQNGDGPSQYLINFMKTNGGVAPDRWEGWHPLTSK